MEKMLRVGALYGVYGPLLTDRQRELVEAYYWDDLSLSEIAENSGTSRQAVSDQLNRAVDKMEEWDRALGLLDKNRKTRETLRRVIERLTAVDSEESRSCAKELEELLSSDPETD